MKVVFVYMGAVNLGIEYLSSMLECHGHTTDLVFDPALFDDKRYFHSPFLAQIFNQENRIIDKIISKKPNLIAFSTITDNYRWACRLAEILKKRLVKTPIVFGGAHPTLVPERVIKNDYVDFLILGEGEYALLELVDSIEQGKDWDKIHNVWGKKINIIISNPLRPLVNNLDELPLPNKDLFQKYIPNQDEYIIISGRGCPYSCTFCCNHVWQKIYKDNGQYLRKRSVEHVIDELKKGKIKYNFSTVYFADEVFTWNREWIIEFAEKYKKEINVPYKCVCHPMQMEDKILFLLKASGCYAIQIGVESTDAETKKSILKRFEDNESVKNAVAKSREYGITIIVDHIFGLPGEKESDLENAAIFYSEIRPHRVTNYTLSYFPKTAIIDTSLKMGILDENRIEKIETGIEDSYISDGSVYDKKQKRIIKNFVVLFTMLPFLSKKIIKYIIEKKLYRFFYIVPSFIISFFDLLTVIFITHEWRGINYLKYYYRELKKNFLN
ncbi:radical SAM protein [Candidatus Poribacteria bacterium]|nr:radical SAM protein [Candidatus Poribacteria bacterium]